MKVIDLLQHSNARDLTRWAKDLGLPIRSTANQSMAERIARRLLDEAFLAERIAILDEIERSALVLFLLMGDEDLVRLSLRATFKNVGRKRDPLATLTKEGLLFRVEDRKRYNRDEVEALWIPAELRFALWRVLLQDPKTESTRLTSTLRFGDVVRTLLRPDDGSDMGQFVQETTYNLLTDASLYLAALKRSPVRVKNDGVIYRTDQRAVTERFVRPDPVPDAQSGYDYSFRLGFIVDWARALRLTVRQDTSTGGGKRSELRLSPLAEEWLRLDAQTRAESLLAYVFCVVFAREDGLRGVWELAAHLPPNKWVLVEPLLDVLDGDTLPGFYREIEYHADHALQYLQSIGGVELADVVDHQPGQAKPQTQGVALRLSDLAQAFVLRERPKQMIEGERHFFVQATGEVMASSRLAHDLLWFLELVCDLEQADQMRVYRLSRERVAAALDDGLERERLISFFEQYTPGGLPQNISFMLEEWCANWGDVRLSAALLIECARDELADTILADGRVGRYVLRRIGPRSLVVDARYADAVRQALAQAGLPTSKRIRLEVGEAGIPSAEVTRRAHRLWQSEVDQVFTDKESGTAGASDNPFDPGSGPAYDGYLDRYGNVKLDHWLFHGDDVAGNGREHPLDALERGAFDPRAIKTLVGS